MQNINVRETFRKREINYYSVGHLIQHHFAVFLDWKKKEEKKRYEHTARWPIKMRSLGFFSVLARIMDVMR